jgi:hypothetical protein
VSATAKYVVATEPLFIGTARAHNPGDLVPFEHVEKYGWDGKVAKPETKAAQAATGSDA